MKKFFAAALASAMVVSMAANSFAAVADGNHVIGNSGASTYSSTDSKFTALASEKKVAYGNTVYYALKDGTGTTYADLVTVYDAVKGTSIKQKWEMNGSLVEKIEIVKKKDVESGITDKYFYYLAVKLKDNTSTKDADLIGTITLKKTGTDGFKTDDKQELPIAVNFVVGYNTPTDNDVIEDALRLHDFTDDEEQTIKFKVDDYSYFTVNTNGQGKLVAKVDNKYNADVAAKYPTANLDFFTGNGATFNKTGELTIAAAPGSFLYQVNADGNLVPVKATYDEYEEAFKVKTRTLNAYVISDVEVKAAVTTPVDPAKPNPGTGANA